MRRRTSRRRKHMKCAVVLRSRLRSYDLNLLTSGQRLAARPEPLSNTGNAMNLRRPMFLYSSTEKKLPQHLRPDIFSFHSRFLFLIPLPARRFHYPDRSAITPLLSPPISDTPSVSLPYSRPVQSSLWIRPDKARHKSPPDGRRSPLAAFL